MTHLLSLTPFRRVIRDYEMICESYYNAIRTASPSQIEAIDMVGGACTTRRPRRSSSGSTARSTSTTTQPAACSP